MNNQKKLRIYIITGEDSGDALGASILTSLQNRNIEYEFRGLAGPRMQALGVQSLFDTSELSIMGFSAVLAKLPKLMKLVYKVVDDVLSFKPDIVLLVDSPEFNAAVAKRVRKKNPEIPIVKYICPSVWAWRQGRAPKMRGYIDHILAILPFEPKLMKELGGPETTYVGHPLAYDLDRFGDRDKSSPSDPMKLLVLPGSRRGEIKRLLPLIQEILDILSSRGVAFEARLPVVDRHQDFISSEITGWNVKPELVSGAEQKHEAFLDADVALACSGTVLLELALYSVPMLSIYKLDSIGYYIRGLFVSWSACLPNLITDEVLVQERFEEYARPQLIARELQQLGRKGHARDAQLEGFRKLRDIMKKDSDNSEQVTQKILDIAGFQTVADPS